MSSELIPAAVAGISATIVGHPLDCVKVHMQTSSHRTTSQCAKRMWQTDGPAAFVRGIGAPILNAVLMNTVMFVGFAESRKLFPDSTSGALLAGALAGFAQACVGTPLDCVKIQTQLGKRGADRSNLVKRMLVQPKSLFVGHTMNLLREGVFTAIYLGLYASIRDQIVGQQHGSTAPPLPLTVFVSATTGALAWLACYPFDTVKSVQQAAATFGENFPSNPKSTIRGAVSALQAQGGGIRVFYKGAGASVFRAALVTSTRMCAYEFVKSNVG